MDGHFVPNITFGPLVVAAVKKCVKIPLDVHLMISNPHKYIDAFCDAGADILTVHAEACENLGDVIEAIKRRNVLVGVCVNPDKPVELFLPYLDKIDQVLIMTVYAGFGGQKFMPQMLDKIKMVREKANTINPALDIEVDGGVNDQTAALCTKAGANVLVAGSFVFGSADYAARINAVRNSGIEGMK
jgi:ribulose-phosphate 3-epimerase